MSGVEKHVEGPARRRPGLTPLWVRTRYVQVLVDVALLSTAFLGAYFLRFDFDVPDWQLGYALRQLPFVVAMQFLVLRLFGVYTFIWRYVGMREIWAFGKASVVCAIPLFGLRLALPLSLPEWRVPLSVTLVDAVLAFGCVLGARVLRRAVYERFEKSESARLRTNPESAKPVLLAGAGRAGVLAMKELLGRGDTGLDIRGFVDDDPEKQGSVIQGVKVLGTTDDLPRLVREYEIDHVIITIAKASRHALRKMVKTCEDIGVRVRITPGLYEILEGNVQVSHIRDVQIEDLLGREPVQLNEDEVGTFLAGKRVMVTGGGGSIGSELCRQVARFGPKQLVVVERSEFALFTIDREMHAEHQDIPVRPVLADVGDEPRMREIFEATRPHVVLHAAAHKHVPLMELNPGEAVKNNALATRGLGRMAGEYGAEVFVLISTDKAVRPTSIMGATKRVAELAVQDLDRDFDTRYVAVRFGNVLGSTGSVIPIFREQIQKGGPITVTHPDMVRFFMTIPEATQLVLQAGAMGRGGEIFILDMGEPVRIVDLAKDMIRLSGLKPGEDVEIRFTGIRSGEKLYEELQTVGEAIAKTRHPKIFMGQIAPLGREELERGLGELARLSSSEKEGELRHFLGGFLPESTIRPANVATEAARKSMRPSPSSAAGAETAPSATTLPSSPALSRSR